MLELVFHNYINIILEFLLEFYVFFFLISKKLKRSSHYYLKLILGIFAVCAFAFGLSFFYTKFGNTSYGRILTYFILFVLISLQMFWCHKESISTILFCSNLTYAIQNLTYKLFLLFICVGEKYSILDSWSNNFNLIYHIVYYSFFFLIAFIIYMFYIKKIQNKLTYQQINNKMLLGSLIILGITIILCSIEDIYFAALSTGERDNQFNNESIYVLRQTSNIFSISSCSIMILLLDKTLEEKKLQEEVEYLQYAVKQSELQYQISKDTIDMINIKCHDIKYKIQSVFSKEGNVNLNVVNELNKEIAIYDTKIETHNKLLNVLLTEKSLFCEQNNIKFSCMADGKVLDFISDGDLYCLFGNIIDNALEAVKEIKEKDRRVINLVIKAKNNFIIIQEDNYFDGIIEFKDGLPLTKKKDKHYHGFGLKSIAMIATKYNGTLTTSTTNDIFHLNIMFSLENDKKYAR